MPFAIAKAQSWQQKQGWMKWLYQRGKALSVTQDQREQGEARLWSIWADHQHRCWLQEYQGLVGDCALGVSGAGMWLKGLLQQKIDFYTHRMNLSSSTWRYNSFLLTVVLDGGDVHCARCTGDFLCLHIRGLSAVTTDPMVLSSLTWGLSLLPLPFDPGLYLSSFLSPQPMF